MQRTVSDAALRDGAMVWLVGGLTQQEGGGFAWWDGAWPFCMEGACVRHACELYKGSTQPSEEAVQLAWLAEADICEVAVQHHAQVGAFGEF
jgi:hypothetical protein